MKKILFLGCFLAAGLLPAHAYTDQSSRLTATEARYQQLDLGSGALAVLTFPDTVENVTVTRDGIVETAMDGNRVIMAGLNNYGETPVMVKTSSGVYTWRIMLSHAHAGRIVNVEVEPAPLPPPLPSVTEVLATAQTQPKAPQYSEFSLQRVGEPGNTSVLFQISAHDEAVTINEAQIVITAAGRQLKPEISSAPIHSIPAGQTGYGVVTVHGAQGPLNISWPYREGQQMKTHTSTLP